MGGHRIDCREDRMCSPQTLHTWGRQHEVDASQRDGIPTADAQRIKDLERENRELRRANQATPAIELASLEWAAWFNHHRLMRALGNAPPAEFEAQYQQQRAGQAATV